MKGIYISAERMAALAEWAANARREAETFLAETCARNQAEKCISYTRENKKPGHQGRVLDIRELINNHYL